VSYGPMRLCSLSYQTLRLPVVPLILRAVIVMEPHPWRMQAHLEKVLVWATSPLLYRLQRGLSV
jgi:hypothetical protein